jgi:16S rRNA (uracil1498-N3)-methyltransferase
MSLPRFYSPEKLSPGSIIRFTDSAATHASRALRMQVDDEAILFNGDGNDYLCSLTFISKSKVSAKVKSVVANDAESPLDITLVQAISSGDRMDFTIQKAVEMGVNRVQPIASQRSVVKLSGDRADKRREHWQNVVIAACEQSGRAIIPPVLPTYSLADWLGQGTTAATRILLLPGAEYSLSQISKPQGSIQLLIGAEGGLTPTEVDIALQHEFIPIRLGKRILRTETAALSAISSMQTLWGDYN